ncbi:hypothetical protein FBQ97_05055 [Acidobacteria bacterium ACD]|nr:MAG: hypothetical protein EDX89_03730 [Acidobacteriota bacterium]MCE7957969.1 hypothetical protein [Acidobacteria bacterium ACB2]MDL1949168.1 hypothetical protein [Acidobacteria bacterium ACD]
MNRDFVEMLSALSEAGAEFLLVGAHALAAHGHPRATGDLDLWVRADAANARRVLQALGRFGSPLFDLSEADLAREGTVFQIGVPPARIDLLTSVSGVRFEEAWPRRTTVTLAGVAVGVIGREDLIRNKRATGRAQDLLDAERLERDAG